MTRRTWAGARLCAATLAIVMPLAAPAADARVDVRSMVAYPVAADATCSITQPPATFTQAGAQADLCVGLSLKSGTPSEFGNSRGLGDDVRDIRLSLPPGQVGSPRAAKLCEVADFRSSRGCTVASQVGTVTAAAETVVMVDERLLQGRIYLLRPLGTEGARVGLQLDAVVIPGVISIPAIKLEAEMRLRPEDNGLDTILNGAPRDFEGIPIELRRMAMRLWGSNRDHPTLLRPFLSSPTDCTQPAVTRAELVSYLGDTTVATDAYTPTDCATLPFSISTSLETVHEADAPTEVTASVEAPDDAVAGRGNANVKRAQLVLPPGFDISASSGADGLVGCTDAQFARTKASAVQCPAGSRIGTVVFRSPLLLADELVGPVFMASPIPGKQLRFFATAQAGPEDDALRVKVEATATVDPVTGQLTTVLEDLPPTPFTLFRFTFRGGPTAILSSPRACGTYTADVTAWPISGPPPATASASTAIDRNCGPEPFVPTLATGVTTAQAGADTSIVADIGRPDGHARLAGAIVDLPPGLAGRLGAVAECPLVWARAGSCPESSRIGSVLSGAGVGPKQLVLPGSVYLTAPYDGSPAGVAVIANAKVGPIDFGRLVVLAKIDVNADASMRMTFTDVPSRMQGVPLNLRTLRLALDRPGFAFNATSCAPATFKAYVASDIGTTAGLTSPYQPTGCDTLPYAPKLSAEILSARKEVADGGHPKLKAVVEQGPGQANSKGVQLTLPAGLSVDVLQLGSVCPLATFDAGQCPEASVIGTITAVTPVLPEPLTGQVRFVSVPGAALPELRIQLRGRISLDMTGKVAIDGKARLVTTLDPIPDTPITRFEMELGGRKDSPLIIGKDLCGNTANPVLATFSSWAGSSAKVKTELKLPECSASATLKVAGLRRGRPAIDLRVTGGRARLNQVRLTLPSGFALARTRSVRPRMRISVRGSARGKKATVKLLSRRRIQVTFPKKVSATSVRVRLNRASIRASRRLRRASNPKLKFTVRTRKTNGRANSLRVAVRPG